MPEILTQEEIDSLLSAVGQGTLPQGAGPTARPSRSQNVQSYDFTRPNRVSKDQVRTLQMLHETFARNLSSAMSAYLRSLVEVRLTSVEQLTYGEFMVTVAVPSPLGIFEMAPLTGGAILEMNLQLVFPMIDRILGGAGRASIQVRDLTEIERTLVDRIFRRILVALQQAWAQFGRFEIRLMNLETRPQFVQLTAPNEMAILATFEVRVGEQQGLMNLCLPLPMLEPVLPRLVTQRWFGRRAEAEGGLSADLRAHLETLSLDVRAFLGEMAVPIGELLRLAPGDVLPLGVGGDLPVVVEIEGQRYFAGRAGRRQRRRAVELTATLDGGGDHHGR